MHNFAPLPNTFKRPAERGAATPMCAVAQVLIKIIAALTAAVALNAHALQISSLSPQGEVSRIRQLVAKFDEAAVNFGDPKAPAPLTLNCNDAQAAKGKGRWISDREWAFEFDNDLPPGVSCGATPVSGFKSTSGALLTGVSSYKFNSGGPFVKSLRPGTYQPIDEEQFFFAAAQWPGHAAKRPAACLVLGRRSGRASAGAADRRH